MATNADATGTQSASPEAVSAQPAQETPRVDSTADLNAGELEALASLAGEGEAPAPGGSVSQTQAPATSVQSAATRNFEFPTFDTPPVAAVDPKRVTMLSDVNLRVKIELGRTRMLVEDVLKLGEGSVVELDKLAGDPVDVYANDRLVARGEILVLDESFCVRISDVVSRDPHRIIR